MEINKPAWHPDVQKPKHTHVPRTKPSKEFRDRFIELQKRISKSSTSREPSDNDVESFEESYNNCGLHIRLGPL